MTLLTQGQVERSLLAIADELERQTYVYARQSSEAAEAEADYKIARSRAYVVLVGKYPKMTVSERDMRAELQSAEQLRKWKLLEAQRQSTKEALLSLRARLDALRSLSANIRHQT